MRKPKLKSGYAFHADTSEDDFVMVPNDDWDTVMASPGDAGEYVGRVHVDGAPCLVWRGKKGGFLAQTCASHGISGMPPSAPPKRELPFGVERVKLDKGGYDPNGRYYGVGEPLWRIDHHETGERQDVRAKTKAQAVTKGKELFWRGATGQPSTRPVSVNAEEYGSRAANESWSESGGSGSGKAHKTDLEWFEKKIIGRKPTPPERTAFERGYREQWASLKKRAKGDYD